jgi:hypothetical protein
MIARLPARLGVRLAGLRLSLAPRLMQTFLTAVPAQQHHGGGID